LPHNDEQELIHEARTRYERAMTADREDRDDARDDQRFVGGDQWDPLAIEARRKAKRPILTQNRLAVMTRQVINESRDQKPALKITAMDAPTPEEQQVYDDTARAMQMRVRQIEYESSADIAYDTSAMQQVESGRGAYRVITEYEPGTFRQRIRIKPIQNQFSVLWDPDAIEYDKADAEYCFVTSTIGKAEYKRRFAKEPGPGVSAFASTDTGSMLWYGGDEGNCQIAEYWYKHYKRVTIYQLPDGGSTSDPAAKEFAVDKRVEQSPEIWQYIIDGFRILEETRWLGSRIPIIPVFGEMRYREGKQRTYSMVRFAKDSQRLVNLYCSNIAEQIAAVPKNPWMVAEGQLDGRVSEWTDANVTPRVFLQYKRFINGIDMGKPEREVHEPPIQALSMGLAQAVDALKATIGVFDASLGAESNEKSGIAIRERKAQSSLANFHFIDNQARSRKALGDILLELIPIVDRGKSTVAGRTEDGKSVSFRLDGPFDDPITKRKTELAYFDAKMQVAVSTGPSYTSQRQEALGVYLEVMKADPAFMEYGRDMFWKNVDAPGAQELSERAEKMLPPQLQEGEEQQIPPDVQAMVANLEQQNQQLMAAVEGLSAEKESKTAEIESRERIESMRLQFEREKLAVMSTIEEMKIGSSEAVNELKARIDALKADSANEQKNLDREERREAAQRAAQAPESSE